MTPTSPKRSARWGYADLYLSLGSNLGDREDFLRKALISLNRSYGRYKALSGIIETEPLGFRSDNRFLNCCVRYSVRRRSPDLFADAFGILCRLKQIEASLGREVLPTPETDADGRRIYRDRPIDIDILFYGSLRTGDETLTVPHPRIMERDFVKIPLREIATPALRRMFKEYF